MTKVKFIEGKEVQSIEKYYRLGYAIRFSDDSSCVYVIWDSEQIFIGRNASGDDTKNIEVELCELI